MDVELVLHEACMSMSMSMSMSLFAFASAVHTCQWWVGEKKFGEEKRSVILVREMA